MHTGILAGEKIVMMEQVDKSFPKKEQAHHDDLISNSKRYVKNDTSRKKEDDQLDHVLLNGLWYLAHPYTVLYEDGTNDLRAEKENFIKASKISATLLRKGVKIFSPISHSHPIHVHGKLVGTNFEAWLSLNKDFMKACVGIILCDGWQGSRGCNFEHYYFKLVKKQILTLQEVLELMKHK